MGGRRWQMGRNGRTLRRDSVPATPSCSESPPRSTFAPHGHSDGLARGGGHSTHRPSPLPLPSLAIALRGRVRALQAAAASLPPFGGGPSSRGCRRQLHTNDGREEPRRRGPGGFLQPLRWSAFCSVGKRVCCRLLSPPYPSSLHPARRARANHVSTGAGRDHMADKGAGGSGARPGRAGQKHEVAKKDPPLPPRGAALGSLGGSCQVVRGSEGGIDGGDNVGGGGGGVCSRGGNGNWRQVRRWDRRNAGGRAATARAAAGGVTCGTSEVVNRPARMSAEYPQRGRLPEPPPVPSGVSSASSCRDRRAPSMGHRPQGGSASLFPPPCLPLPDTSIYHQPPSVPLPPHGSVG